jgi:hypothetical protein
MAEPLADRVFVAALHGIFLDYWKTFVFVH